MGPGSQCGPQHRVQRQAETWERYINTCDVTLSCCCCSQVCRLALVSFEEVASGAVWAVGSLGDDTSSDSSPVRVLTAGAQREAHAAAALATSMSRVGATHPSVSGLGAAC
jgi:hypothetical protein